MHQGQAEDAEFKVAGLVVRGCRFAVVIQNHQSRRGTDDDAVAKNFLGEGRKAVGGRSRRQGRCRKDMKRQNKDTQPCRHLTAGAL